MITGYLDAIDITTASLSAGYIISDDGKTWWDLDTNEFVVTDGTNVRIVLGNLEGDAEDPTAE